MLLAIKTDHPSWSVRQVNKHAIASGQLPAGVRLARSTEHRLLHAEGLMHPPAAERRRFSSATRPVVGQRLHARPGGR